MTIAATLALAIGCVSLITWLTGYAAEWASEGVITVKTNSALATILASGTLLMLDRRTNSVCIKRIGQVAGLLVFLIGALTLCQHVFKLNFGIDQLICAEPAGARATVSPNRMGPPASLCFTLIGLALWLLSSVRRRSVPAIGLIICIINLIPAVGFLYGVYELYGTANITGIALPTVVSLFSLGLALIFSVKEGPILELMLRDDSGGKLLRNMLPTVLGLPLLLGFLRTLGERAELYNAPVGRGLLVLAMTLVFLILVWGSARNLSNSEQEQKRAERALRESEERFWHLADSAPVIVWVCDSSGSCTFLSRAWYEFTGQTPQTGLGSGWSNAIHSEDRQRVITSCQTAGRDQTAFQLHYRLKRRDEAVRFMHSSATPRFGADGLFLGFIGSVIDVTDEREREIALRNSERLYRAIGESIDYGVWICDASGRNTYASESFLKLVGLTQDQCSEFGWGDVLHPEDRTATIQEWKNCTESGGQWDREHRVRGVDGRWHPVLARGVPVSDDKGEITAWAGINLDISKLKFAEYHLRDAAALLEGTLDALGKHIAILSPDGTILRVNAAWRRFAMENGFQGVEYGVGHNYLDACAPRSDPKPGCSWDDRQAIDGIQAVIRGDLPKFSLEYECHSPSEERWFVMHVTRFGEADALRIVVSHEDVTKRHQAEQIVRENAERLRLATEATKLGTWDVHLDSGRVVLDMRCRKLFGLEKDGTLNYSQLLKHLHFEDRERIDQKVKAALDPHGSGRLEGECRIKGLDDGIDRWIRVTGQTFFTLEEPVRLLGTAEDISDEKAAEAALRETDRRTRALLEGLPQLIWTCSPDGRCQYLSNRWVEYTGISERDQLGEGWIKQVHPDDQARVVEAWMLAIERERRHESPEYRIEFRIRRHDGQYRWFAVSGEPLYDASGKLIRWVGANTDIQSIRDAEAAVRESEEKFRNLAESMSQFAWIADARGSVFWFNRRWFEYTGAAMDDMQGWGWTRTLHPDHADQVIARIQHSWDTGTPWEDTIAIRSHDGNYRWFLSHALPIRDDSGAIIQWFGTNTDITEQLESQSALKAAKESAEAANQAKDKFIAVLSHELRTPLTPVLMSISALEFDPELDSKLREDMQVIRRNVELEVKLIDDLLDISRITSGKLELQFQALDLNAALRHVCVMCRSLILEKQIRLHTDYDDTVGRILGDPARLQQVLWNILKNAVKFTPEKGEVHVTTQRRGDRVIIRTRDTGIGIPPEILPKVFDAFEQGDSSITRQFGGLGLGLAISRAIVEMHNGTIHAESNSEIGGTEIMVELPAAAVQAVESLPVIDNKRSPVSQRPHLLLVEDHGDTVRILGRLLRMSGYEVTTAGSVREALESLETQSFAIIVSDIGLPDATGFELMQKIRETSNVPAIAMSGFGTDEDMRKSRSAGFNEHLVKPVDVSQLESAIKRLMDNPS